LLNISSNNLNRFEKSNLAVFNRFVNLKVLLIGNEDPARVRDGIYNRWNNSLEQLQDSNLVSLGISNTDIDRGLENLSSTLKMIHCSNNLKEFKN
jgi:hypothetical protein